MFIGGKIEAELNLRPGVERSTTGRRAEYDWASSGGLPAPEDSGKRLGAPTGQVEQAELERSVFCDLSARS